MTDASSPDQIPVAETDTFRVVIFARPDEPDALIDVLTQAFDLNRVDARIQAHAMPGLLPERLNQDQAADVVQKIRAIGLSASAILESSIPNLDHPEVIHHATCGATGFEIAGLAGSRRSLIAWGDIELMSLGWVALESARHFTSRSQVVVFSAPHSVEEKIDVASIHGAELWLITKNPDRVYRLDQDHMNYEYLNERMTDSAATNFREFFKDLTRFAQSAYRTPATHAFEDQASVERYRFETSADLKKETLLHLLLHREQLRAQLKTALTQ